MLKDSIKKGFGFALGMSMAGGVIMFAHEKLMKWAANNESLMEFEKGNDPKFYEKLKTYK